ncbi:MAG TPA: ABC transporter ATP-binding protein [Candidatus Deferrimicrobium sp.]|nr:ABC transporter ATP-binding protein [Candidatus Deferrimicrobium sp.]
MKTGKINNVVVELENVSRIYQLGKLNVTAIRDISLKINSGEFLAIMGPSGSGKSTLLNLIGALDTPTSGRILIENEDISKMNDTQLTKIRRSKIGFIFQFYNLIPVLNALENVELPMMAAGISRKNRLQHAESLLSIVGLGDRLKHRPEELSGGERQRVAIARSLANNPSIILGDEPTGDLDTETGMEIMQYLKNLNQTQKTKTFIIVTHNPLIANMTNKIIYLKDGMIEKIESKM